MREWDILVILRSSIILENTLTFAECRKRLHITIADKAEQNDEAVQRHRQITARTGHCGIGSSMTTFTTNMAGAIGSATESMGGGAKSLGAGAGSMTISGGTGMSANKYWIRVL